MATLSIPVADLSLDAVLDFFCLQLIAPYSPFLPDGVTPNPLSKQDHVELNLAQYYSRLWNNYLKQTLIAAYEAGLTDDTSIG